MDPKDLYGQRITAIGTSPSGQLDFVQLENGTILKITVTVTT